MSRCSSFAARYGRIGTLCNCPVSTIKLNGADGVGRQVEVIVGISCPKMPLFLAPWSGNSPEVWPLRPIAG